MAAPREKQMMSRFQTWSDHKDDDGPDQHEEIEKMTQLVGEDSEFILG